MSIKDTYGYDNWRQSYQTFVMHEDDFEPDHYMRKDNIITFEYSAKNKAITIYKTYCYWSGYSTPYPDSITNVTETVFFISDDKLEKIEF